MTDLIPILYPAVRGLLFITLLTLVGTRVVSLILRRHREILAGRWETIRTWVAPLPWLAGCALLVLVLARGSLQVLSFLDPGDPVTLDLAATILLRGVWGHAWLLQLIAALLLIVVAWRFRRSGERRFVVLVLTLAAVWAQSGMGHPVEQVWPAPLGRVIDSAHLIGAGLWLGTLGVLAVAVFPSLHGDDGVVPLARIVADFSVWARVGAALLLLTGGFAAWWYSGSLGVLVSSQWGRLLLIKLGVLAGVAAIGAWNWKVLTPALERAEGSAARRLRRAVRLELGLGVLLLAVTALLVATALPGES